MRRALGIAIATLLAAASQADVIFYEAIGGDLSNDPNAPTPILLSEGIGSVIAAVNVDTDQQDWFAVTIPAGFVLSSLVLGDYDSQDPVAFAGFQRGSTFRGSYLEPSQYNGYSHIGNDVRFTDILPLMGNQTVNPGSLGFNIPLESGVYTFLVQQTGGPTLYQLDFEVTAVPAPAALALGATGLVIALRRRR
jgi:hypothetical protein